MLQIKYDLNECCGVIDILPGPQTNDDWRQGAALYLELDRAAHQRNSDWVILVLTHPGSQRPDATWRKRLTEQRNQYLRKRRLMVMVTDSILFRGALATANLLVRTDGDNIITATLIEGIQRAEEWRKRPILVFRDFLAQTQQSNTGAL